MALLFMRSAIHFQHVCSMKELSFAPQNRARMARGVWRNKIPSSKIFYIPCGNKNFGSP